MATVKKKFIIKDMHCTSCALTIDMDLEDLEGIKQAKTNYAKAETEVEFDEDKLSTDDIMATIKRSGYTSQLVG